MSNKSTQPAATETTTETPATKPAPKTDGKPKDDKSIGAIPAAINVDEIKAKVIANAHPIANIFPMMSGDEFTNLCVSMRTNGFDPSNPIKRQKGTGKITDGRNREAAAMVVNAEIALWNADSANVNNQKTPITPAYIEEESDNDAGILATVMQDNFTRRNMSSSQKAAVLVKAGVLSAAYTKREELGELGKKVAGDVAMLVAAQHGVNHDYVYKAKTIAKTKGGVGKKLLDAICAGEKTIMEAWAEVKALGDGKPKEGDDNTNPVNPDAVVDGKKNPVPDEWAETFKIRGKFAEAAKLLRQAKAILKEITATEGGQLLGEGNNLKEANNGIAQTAKAIKNTEPHVLCPHCDGTGKHPDKGDKHVCPACGGLGWLTEPQYDAYLKHGVMEEGEGEGEADKAETKPKAKKGKKAKAETNGAADTDTDTEPTVTETVAAGAESGEPTPE